MFTRIILPVVICASMTMPACTEEPKGAVVKDTSAGPVPAAMAPVANSTKDELSELTLKDLYRFGVERVQDLPVKDRAVMVILWSDIKDAPLTGVQFSDAIEFLWERTGLNIIVRWPVLTIAGIGRDKILTRSLKNVYVHTCIEQILNDVSSGTTANLDYGVKDGIVIISTREDLASNVGPPRAYNIRDLLKLVPESTAPYADFLTYSSDEDRYPRDLSGGGKPTRDEMINRIQNIIQNSIAPNSWTYGTGSMSATNGDLIVSQTPENHGKILQVLKNLREAKRLQNYVDAGALSCAARRKLCQEAKEVRLVGKGLKEGMNFIRDNSGLNMQVRWGALKLAGIRPDTKIDVRLANIPLRKVLEIMLDDVASDTDSSLGYAIREGVLVVSTGDDLAVMEQLGGLAALQANEAGAAHAKKGVSNSAEYQPASATRPAGKPLAETMTVAGNNAFAIDLYGRLGKQEKGNLFFSPASAHVALSLTYMGAAGDTASQMAGVLHLDQKNEKLPQEFQTLMENFNNPIRNLTGEPSYKLTMANRLWIQTGYDLKDKFFNISKLNFLSSVGSLDFDNELVARKTINDWVSQKTKGKIRNLIGPGIIDHRTKLVIANAVYFKAEWNCKFKKDDTKLEDFFTRPDKPVKTDLMHITAGFNYTETDDLQMIEMPYMNNEMSMVVLLPAKKDGLAAMEKTLSAARLKKLLAQARSKEVIVTFPKFTCEGTFSLKETLIAMGMADAFCEKANFTGISETANSWGGLLIQDVLQKAFVVVDEEGTEAAAATTVIGGIFGLDEPKKEEPKVFTADHPFIYLIRHVPTGEIVFMGRLADPAK